MKKNISGSIDLLKLNGAKVINGKGDIPHVVIPIDQAKLNVFKRDNGVQSIYLNLYMLSKDDDKYGNDFMVSRATTKEESEHNKSVPVKEDKTYGEILGNAKFFEAEQREQGSATSEPAGETFEGGDDLPF